MKKDGQRTYVSSEVNGHALRVLIVEDDLLIAMDVEMQIEQLGHSVVGTAVTADEAIAMAKKEKPDIGILDLRLADGSSGEDAAKELYLRMGIRSIFSSGNLDLEMRTKLSELNPIAFIDKPMLSGELKIALSQASH